MSERLLRPKEVATKLGISRATLWRIEQSDPHFPRKIVITSRCVGWRESALDAWLKAMEGGL